MSAPGRVARLATMFREDATLGECELWLRDLRYKDLEGRATEREILRQVLQLLNNDFLRNGLRVEKVDSEGLWLKDSANVELLLGEMSEGYRAALAMLVDILRHVVNVYGHEDLLNMNNGTFTIEYPGVVLIDEMDSHLHPDWQRQIGFWLKQRFPKIQFIVTTHSAFVCQAADMNGIFHLPAPGRMEDPFQVKELEYWKIVKSKPDAIYLSPVFGMQYTRSPRAVKARLEYAELRAKQRAGVLTEGDANQMQQLEMFVDDDDGE